jgi:hypothetical protein
LFDVAGTLQLRQKGKDGTAETQGKRVSRFNPALFYQNYSVHTVNINILNNLFSLAVKYIILPSSAQRPSSMSIIFKKN